MAGVPVSCYRMLLFVIVGAILLLPAMADNAWSQTRGPHGRSSAMTAPTRPPLTPKGAETARSTPEAPAPKEGICRIVVRKFFSSACSQEMAYYAFVPGGVGSGKRYPVLYLLHGAFGSYRDWKDHAGKELCELASKYRLIIITPEGENFGWYADSRFLKNNHIESYFFKELIPDVERNFPANGLRSIAGLSMGGHGAFVLCLRHPGQFVSVSSMSGILDITRHKRQWRLSKVFGPYGNNSAVWNRHSVLKLLAEQKEQRYIRSLPMLITVSTGDPYSLDDNRLVHEELDSLKISHCYRESAGTHDWTYWLSELPQHVAFHAEQLKRARLRIRKQLTPGPDHARCF
ncbi:MAG: alpha/beta hydrolase family protein [Syntrophobacteraceae bacterium]|nr:alpha/beta hydrolase family protein [Syntrophobacteraceae bacterium]